MSNGNRGQGGWQQGRPQQPGGSRPSGGQAGGGGPRTGGEGEPFRPPSEADLRAIIVEGDALKLVETAERVGKALAQPGNDRDKLSTSQIRAFFGAVREIEMRWSDSAAEQPPVESSRRRQPHRDLLLLKPKLAYQAARARSDAQSSGQGARNLKEVLEPAISLVGEDRERFQSFVEFFEAILAYHRAHGGK